MTIANNEKITIGSLKKRADFLRVQSAGKKWVTKSFILRQLKQPEADRSEDGQNTQPDTQPDIRFGLTVTKKLFKNATDRNRVKRRLRAAIQACLTERGEAQTDYVLIGRKETIDREFKDLKRDLTWALKRIKDIE